jgi:hypothetical protein
MFNLSCHDIAQASQFPVGRLRTQKDIRAMLTEFFVDHENSLQLTRRLLALLVRKIRLRNYQSITREYQPGSNIASLKPNL